MLRESKEFILNSFSETADEEDLPDPAYEDALEELHGAIEKDDFSEVEKILNKYSEKYNADFSEILEFIEVYESEKLFQGGEEESEKNNSIDKSVETAIKSRIANTDKDNMVSYINKDVNNVTLKSLTKDIFNEYNKSVFFVSPNEKLEGRISVALSETKDKYSLFEAYDKEDGMRYRFFGESKVRGQSLSKLTEGFMTYKFVSDNEEYLVFSQEPLKPQRCEIEGQVYRINDSKKVGENRQLSISQDIIFAHTVNPSVRMLDEKELFRVVDEHNHESLAESLLGRFRHPKWFEKLLLSLNFVNEEFDFPTSFFWLGPTRTGKSMVLESFNKSLDERRNPFSGSNSTVKGLTPSFAETPVSEGYLLKTQRAACVDEFLNILQSTTNSNANTQDAFRPLLDLLTHKSTQFGSGNGDITAKMESTLFAVGNPCYGIDNIIDACKKLDDAFMARLLVYDQTESHIDFINERKKETGTLSDKEMMPERDDDFISLVDTLKNHIHLNKEISTEKISEIKKDLRDSVPTEMDVIYKNGYDQHFKNLLVGLAKYHTIIDNRDEFTVKEKDYEEVKRIMEIIINSWNESVNYNRMRPSVRVEYLQRDERVIYNLIDKNNKLTKEELEEMTDTPKLDRLISKLLRISVVKELEEDIFAPHWYGGDI